MFNDFKLALQRQFKKMTESGTIFITNIDKDLLWDMYLFSFPTGTNPIYKERTEHDCQCCKQFIRNVGGIVSIQNGKLVSIWDIHVDNFYQVVANILSIFVKSHSINNIFLHPEKNVGVDKNFQDLGEGQCKAWEHFHFQLPSSLIESNSNIGTRLADYRATKEVMLRSLQEITLDSIDTIIDLIDQNSLYRGEEHNFALKSFRKLLIEFQGAPDKDLFCWANFDNVPLSVSRIRNTVIGTLLTDLSEGVDLERAIASFEAKVAPSNYKRPTAPITKAMIDKAKEKLTELGMLSALDRRFATLEDISINNVLFADREARKKMDNVFDELSSQTSSNLKNLDKVEEIGIEDFIANVLPKATSLELMFENRHSSNLVSLIAPSDITAKGMFKWSNNFSWSYNGEMADSIKERVKNAGGRVDGDLRCSLSWFNFDDLDLHMTEPNGNHIYYGYKRSATGHLDVDMNAGSGQTRNPVENICYPNKDKMQEGIYKLQVYNFSKRESDNVGFEVEVEFNGIIHTFSYANDVKNGKMITVAEIQYSHKEGFKIVKSIPSTQASKIIWNIPTQTFHKVSLVLLSPNYWDNKAVGNKHYFFILNKCLNDGKARGFFNEFLASELDAHRKVFEVVGSKTKVTESENQLSGVGFSSTQRNSVLCKVTSSFTRTIKILF